VWNQYQVKFVDILSRHIDALTNYTVKLVRFSFVNSDFYTYKLKYSEKSVAPNVSASIVKAFNSIR